jgi:rubredoxin
MKKVFTLICGTVLSCCVISSCGSNAGNTQTEPQNGEPAKQEQAQPEGQTQSNEAEKPDLTKKYICPNRDFSSDDANAVCPVCGMDGFTENN